MAMSGAAQMAVQIQAGNPSRIKSNAEIRRSNERGEEALAAATQAQEEAPGCTHDLKGESVSVTIKGRCLEFRF